MNDELINTDVTDTYSAVMTTGAAAARCVRFEKARVSITTRINQLTFLQSPQHTLSQLITSH